MNIERETFMAKLNGDLGKLFFHFIAVILTIKIWVLQFLVSVSERLKLKTLEDWNCVDVPEFPVIWQQIEVMK